MHTVVLVEAACLGTKAVRCDSFAGSKLDRGNFVQFEQIYGLLANFHSREQDRAIDEALRLALDPELDSAVETGRTKLLEDTINVSAFMKWFVSEYPGSAAEMRSDPATGTRRFGRGDGAD